MFVDFWAAKIGATPLELGLGRRRKTVADGQSPSLRRQHRPRGACSGPAQTGRGGCGEVRRHGLSDLAGGGPLRAAQKKSLEAGAAQCGVGSTRPEVAEHGRVDASVPVGDRPIHGLVFPGVFRVGVVENRQTFRGAVLPVRELFVGMEPRARQAAGDRMPGVQHGDDEVVLGAVTRSATLAGGDRGQAKGVVPRIVDEAPSSWARSYRPSAWSG